MEPVPHADMAVADVHTADEPYEPDDYDDDHPDVADHDNDDVVVERPTPAA